MPDPGLSLALRRVVDRYIRAFSPERILLFGSHAKGTNEITSDVDLLIIAELPGDVSTHLRQAHQLAADSFPPVDVVFAAPEEIESSRVMKNPFLMSILGSSITIYQRDQSG